MGFFDGAPLEAPAGLGFATGMLDRRRTAGEDEGWLETARTAAPPASSRSAVTRRCSAMAMGCWSRSSPPTGSRTLGPQVETLFLGLDRRGCALRRRYRARPPRCAEGADGPEADRHALDRHAGPLHARPRRRHRHRQGAVRLHQRHRFCSHCGAPSAVACAGWKRACPSCRTEHFPRTDPVVIMLTIDGDRCLMGRGAQFPEGRYSCLAGFVEPGETIEDAVRRETFEETSIRTGRVRYLFAQPWPFRAR